jgi:hypothetical protein
MNQYMLSPINEHQQLQLLLPWYINESLGEVERLQVEGHIHGCLLCNRELVALRKLQTAVNQASILQMAAEVSFASVCEKMQRMVSDSVCLIPSSQEPAFNSMGRSVNRRAGFFDKAVKKPKQLLRLSDTPAKRFAIAASILVVLGMQTMPLRQSPINEGYYTLSAAKPELVAGVKLRVVFANTLKDADINLLLEEIHGQRLEGPNSMGALTVKLEEGKKSLDVEDVITFLRKQENVVMVEPVITP